MEQKDLDIVYSDILKQASDPKSRLYSATGKPRRDAQYKAAFWDGAKGRTIDVLPNTLRGIAYSAGRQFLKAGKRKERDAPSR